ncbi:hypothetical protein NPIL_469931 [Nephila pilipes]|uniref:Uncharacterized protein n=1 Tax=Nephila pilipes TaxID=299642 RepID=A0A8X6THV1_NEPPI|nr:hypothetical protein NPIL_469931 [Nephila pilipes]
MLVYSLFPGALFTASNHAAALFQKCSRIALRNAVERRTLPFFKEMSIDSRSRVITMKSFQFCMSANGSNNSDMQLYLIIVPFLNSNFSETECSLNPVPILEGDFIGFKIVQLIIKTLNEVQLDNYLVLWVNNTPVMVKEKTTFLLS